MPCLDDGAPLTDHVLRMRDERPPFREKSFRYLSSLPRRWTRLALEHFLHGWKSRPWIEPELPQPMAFRGKIGGVSGIHLSPDDREHIQLLTRALRRRNNQCGSRYRSGCCHYWLDESAIGVVAERAVCDGGVCKRIRHLCKEDPVFSSGISGATP